MRALALLLLVVAAGCHDMKLCPEPLTGPRFDSTFVRNDTTICAYTLRCGPLDGPCVRP